MKVITRARTGLRRALGSESGAFDLQSVVTGALVTGVLAGASFATVFGVIPWAQDNTASDSLQSLHAAQAAARNGNNGYMATAGLIGADFLDKSSSSVTATNTAASCYVGLSKSGTGKIFYVTDTVKDPVTLAGAATNVPGGCLTTTEFATLKASIGTTATAGAPTLAAPLVTEGTPVGTTVEFTWSPVPDAQSYIVEYATTGGWVMLDPQMPGTSAKVQGKAGAPLKVRVQAVAGTATSVQTTSATVTLPAVPAKPVLNTPTIVLGSAAAPPTAAVPSTATFTWAAVTNATSYSVEYRINGGAWQLRARNQESTSSIITSAFGDVAEIRVAATGASGSSALVARSAQL